MNYIVLDMEWNQALDLKSKIKEPVVLHGEIVQIGAVKLDENCQIIDTFKMMVAPKYYTKMNKKITEITKITTAELKFGSPFPLVLDKFKHWCGDNFVFLTWGPDDIGILKDNIAIHELDKGWLPKTYDLQVIFDDQITKENRQASLSYAMEKLGEPALEAHDALNDAKNTVCVCRHLDLIKGISEYSSLRSKAKNGHKTNATLYKTKREALHDSSLTSFYCPACGEVVYCKNFVTQNSHKYISISKCKNGKEFFVRIKLIKCKNGKFRASRMIYEADDKNKSYYSLKKREEKNIAVNS